MLLADLYICFGFKDIKSAKLLLIEDGFDNIDEATNLPVKSFDNISKVTIRGKQDILLTSFTYVVWKETSFENY